MAKPKLCNDCARIPWSDFADRRCICHGFNLDLGCGGNKQKGYVGMDRRNLPGVDIVWDIESVAEVPFWARHAIVGYRESAEPGQKTFMEPVYAHAEHWPIPDAVVDKLLMSHVMEHITPAASINVMNEMWRVMHWQGQALMSVPHADSFGFRQDPTHTKMINEGWPAYFDPKMPGDPSGVLWNIYKPLPWRVARMHSSPLHNIELILEPRKKQDGSPIDIFEVTPAKRKARRRK